MIENFYAKKATNNFENQEYIDALDNLTKAIGLEPGNALLHNFRGVVNARCGEFEEAFEDFNQAIKLNNKKPIFFRNRADTLVWDFHDYKGAIEDYDQAIKLNNSDPELFTSRANAKEELKDYKGAVKDHIKAEELEKNNKKELKRKRKKEKENKKI